MRMMANTFYEAPSVTCELEVQEGAADGAANTWGGVALRAKGWELTVQAKEKPSLLILTITKHDTLKKRGRQATTLILEWGSELHRTLTYFQASNRSFSYKPLERHLEKTHPFFLSFSLWGGGMA